MCVSNFIRPDFTQNTVVVGVKRVLNVVGSVNIQVLFKLQLFVDVKEEDMARCFFSRRYVEVNEENKENYPVCVLCCGQHHREEMDFLIYICLCKNCIKKMEPICRHCVTTNEIFVHLCYCMNYHRYDLTQFIW